MHLLCAVHKTWQNFYERMFCHLNRNVFFFPSFQWKPLCQVPTLSFTCDVLDFAFISHGELQLNLISYVLNEQWVPSNGPLRYICYILTILKNFWAVCSECGSIKWVFRCAESSFVPEKTTCLTFPHPMPTHGMVPLVTVIITRKQTTFVSDINTSTTFVSDINVSITFVNDINVSITFVSDNKYKHNVCEWCINAHVAILWIRQLFCLYWHP